MGPRLLPRAGGLPDRHRPRQVLAAGGPHRPGVRRPQPGVRVPAAGSLRRVTDHVADLTARRLRARLAHAQSTGRLPSVVAGLVRDGEPVWFDAYGDPAVPGHDPYEVQYRIGSLNKKMKSAGEVT